MCFLVHEHLFINVWQVLFWSLGFFVCLFFRATLAIYGNFQARGRTAVAAACLHHSHIATWDPSCICDLNHSSRQRWILNPLNEEARDRTSWLLVGFLSTVPQRGLLQIFFFDLLYATTRIFTYIAAKKKGYFNVFLRFFC